MNLAPAPTLEKNQYSQVHMKLQPSFPIPIAMLNIAVIKYCHLYTKMLPKCG
jgi:hypothetical protein